MRRSISWETCGDALHSKQQVAKNLASACSSLRPNLIWRGSSVLWRSNANVICRRRSRSPSFRSQHQLPSNEPERDQPLELAGLTILYVGGRAHNVVQLRMLVERSGAVFLHHDGGMGDRMGLLESHVATADMVFFPVDCVSHNAVAVVKRVARRLGKRYLPLRSSGLASFVIALRREAASPHDTSLGGSRIRSPHSPPISRRASKHVARLCECDLMSCEIVRTQVASVLGTYGRPHGRRERARCGYLSW